MKNLTIIGGHGFIGKNFTDFFLHLGFNITLIGNNSRKDKFPNSVKSITADVQDVNKIVNFTKDSEIVIWLATSLIPSSDKTSLETDFECNVKPIIAFLEKSNKTKLKTFIYLSSGGTIYGNANSHVPIVESYSKSPISEYGLSKLVAENYIQFITKNSNFQTYILRPSNVYGKYQNLNKPQGIIGFAFKSLVNNTTLELYDDGKVIRDFVYVTDLAEVVLKCINATLQPSQTHIYNVGSGKAHSIKEIILKIGEIAEITVSTIPKASRNFDCEYNVLSIEKIKDELNWKPKIAIDDGLKLVWEWIKTNEND